MPKSRGQRVWWDEWRDRSISRFPTAAGGEILPLDFVDAEYLIALGVAYRAVELESDQLYLDPHRLAAYEAPQDADDGLVLTANDAPSSAIRRSASGTTITANAAYCLWSARKEAERDGLLNTTGWCTRCGMQFVDKRASPNGGFRNEDGPRRYASLRIPPFCPVCRKLSRTLPPKRQCGARDCEQWFQPTDGKQIFHRPACQKAESRAAARSRDASEEARCKR